MSLRRTLTLTTLAALTLATASVQAQTTAHNGGRLRALIAQKQAAAAPAVLSAGVQRIADVPYGVDPAQRMDVYVPTSPTGAGTGTNSLVASAVRAPAFPDVPTLKEQGLALETESWSGALVPAATPAAVITRLNTDIGALLLQPELRDQLARQGMNAVGGPPERFGELVKSELTRWARVVAAAKIKYD
mgnify:CR=1 FL=1